MILALASLAPAAEGAVLQPNPQAFQGTWTEPYNDGQLVLTLDANGNGSMKAQGAGGPGAPKEDGTISSCVPSSGELACTWTSTYSDGDKTITRGGPATLSVSGTSLTFTSQVDDRTISEHWNDPSRQGGPSAAKTGGTHVLTLVGGQPANPNEMGRYRLVVQVLSADRNEPVGDAKVTSVFHYSFNPSEVALRQTETTDSAGNAYIVYDFSGPGHEWRPYYGWRLTIHHPDFADSSLEIPIAQGQPSGDIPVRVSLTRQADRKVVAVHVTSANGQPVYDAHIAMRGTRKLRSGLTSSAMYDATTDVNGNALINVTEGDDYDVTVTHDGYESATTKLTVKLYGDEPSYSLAFQLTPIERNAARMLNVHVVTRDPRGNDLPVHYAEVTLPNGEHAMTDYRGHARLRHNLPIGEEVRVTAEANHFREGEGSFTVGVRAGGSDNVTIYLERAGT